MILVLIRKLPAPADARSPLRREEAYDAVRERRKETEKVKLLLLHEGLRAMMACPAPPPRSHFGSPSRPAGAASDKAGRSPAGCDEGGIGRSPDGKPFFIDHPGIRFNISHSGEWVACAFSAREVGLDIQQNQERSGRAPTSLDIARRFFTPEEYEALLMTGSNMNVPEHVINNNMGTFIDSSAPGSQDGMREELFFRLWTIKEAWLKYLGCGLSGRLDSFLPSPLPLEERMPERDLWHLPDVPPCGRQSPDNAGASTGRNRPYAGGIPLPLPAPDDSAAGREGGLPSRAPLLRGKIVPAHGHQTEPGMYAILPAPKGYTMSVCAEEIPERIDIRVL